MPVALSFRLPFAIFPGVNLPRLLLPFAFVLFLTGCQNKFTRIRATNYRDEIIADWTARGGIVPIARGGYRITAVERLSPPPHPKYTRYPDGWRTTVQGAHIWHWRCPKPLWLAELEGDVPATIPATKRVARVEEVVTTLDR